MIVLVVVRFSGWVTHGFRTFTSRAATEFQNDGSNGLRSSVGQAVDHRIIPGGLTGFKMCGSRWPILNAEFCVTIRYRNDQEIRQMCVLGINSSRRYNDLSHRPLIGTHDLGFRYALGFVGRGAGNGNVTSFGAGLLVGGRLHELDGQIAEGAFTVVGHRVDESGGSVANLAVFELNDDWGSGALFVVEDFRVAQRDCDVVLTVAVHERGCLRLYRDGEDTDEKVFHDQLMGGICGDFNRIFLLCAG